MFKPLLALFLAFFAAVSVASTEVNTATPAELDAIKGIGPATAAKIVEERKKAPFKDWNDLVSRVKGVGQKNSAEFSAAGLTVNGAAMTGMPASPATTKKTATPKAVAPAAAVVAPANPTAPVATSTPPAAATTAAPAATTAAATNSTAATSMSAADRKAAAKQERDEKRAAKKAAKAASAGQAASASAKK